MILTAAHCIPPSSKVEVWAGCSGNLNDCEKKGQVRNATMVLPHPLFSDFPQKAPQKYDNDLGLVLLEKPLVLNGEMRKWPLLMLQCRSVARWSRPFPIKQAIGKVLPHFHMHMAPISLPHTFQT